MSVLTQLRHNHLWRRLKHRKGEGIHSPYAYEIVSRAFARRDFISHDCRLYDELRKDGVGHKYAAKLQNLYTCLGYTEFLIDGRERLAEPRVVYVMTPRTNDEAVRKMIDEVKSSDSVVCMTSPRTDSGRYRFCRELIDGHMGLSMDITGCVLLFHRRGLSKQHLKL